MSANQEARFTPEQMALLEKYFTSATDPVYVMKGPEGLKGALSARVSRAATGVRETFLEEFVENGSVKVSRGDELIDRVLNAIGDDSVAELENTHVVFERISVLNTKEWEDRRIGGSPIEKSTRYVFFDKRDEQGNFPYHRDKKIMASPAATVYVEAMDFIFQTYCDLIPPLTEFYKAWRPLDTVRYKLREKEEAFTYADCKDDEERKKFRFTYKQDIRTQACDTLRCILPLSTEVVMVINGNGRYFLHALNHCYSQALSEVRDVATKAHGALDNVIPKYVQRAKASPYLIRLRESMRELVPTLRETLYYGYVPSEHAPISLLDFEPDLIIDVMRRSGGLNPSALLDGIRREEDSLVIACMLFPYCDLPLSHIRNRVRVMRAETTERIIAAYVGDRQSRRDRPGRAFEAGYPYTFDNTTDFGTFKDLERHRMCTQLRQEFSPHLGFNMPADIIIAGFKGQVDACVEKAQALHAMLVSSGFRDEAQYATLHGSAIRWVLGINDRGLHHMLELRTQPQGHSSYRKACQEMHRLATARSPWRGNVMQFVDHKDYVSARGDSEARQRVKEDKLGITVQSEEDNDSED